MQRIKESQQRVASIAENAKRKLAEAQLIAEVKKTHGIGVAESMKFRIGEKEPRVKALYPKTNAKRIADEWNEKVGAWHKEHKAAGHQLLVRHGDEPLVVDAVDDEGQYETMVVRGRNGKSHGDFTIDFLNQRHGAKNEHSGDFDHEGTWTFKKALLGSSAASDQRNKPTTKSDSRRKRGRKKDGQSLMTLAKTNKPAVQ
jgi:hypothetical protein